MTGRRLTVGAQHPDGRLRLSDLRRIVEAADQPSVLPGATIVPPIDDDALVIVSYRAMAVGRASITLAEVGAQ